MSNTEPTQQQAGAVPPPITVQKSKNPLEAPFIGEKPRTVKGKAAQEFLQTSAIGPEDIVRVRTRRMPQGEEFTPAELARRYSQSQGEINRILGNVVSADVKTTKLINSRGEIARDQYNPDDATYELQKMRPADRISFLNELYKRDMFPGTKGPSATGLDSSSINAMETFLMLVNSTGYTMDVAKPMVFATYDPIQGLPGTGGAPRKYTVSNPQDISSIADRVAEEIIGRRLTESQKRQIIKQVQSAERRAGMQQGTELIAAPDPRTIAQQQVEERFSGEAQSVRMGSVGKIFDDFLRSL